MVGQLDPEQMAALGGTVSSWAERLVEELSRQLRVKCVARPPYQRTMAQRLLPPPDEEPFWGAMAGFPSHRVLVSLPRAFAVALCERMFGAPFQVREERPLT